MIVAPGGSPDSRPPRCVPPQSDIHELLPEQETEQTKLQILIIELRTESRSGESEERA